MASINRPWHQPEQSLAVLSPIQQLRRTILTCMLWEDNFYESGVSVADRIKALVPACEPQEVSRLAIEARTTHHLRHVPLLLVRELARGKGGRLVGDTIYEVIQRPDDMTELVALYWADAPGKMIPKQMRLGLARAFRKFDEYQLAKYDRQDKPVKLRDVLFMVHGKPEDGMEGYTKGVRQLERSNGTDGPRHPHEELYRKLVDGTLSTPDTWETRLSGGQDKAEAFTALLEANKLGGLALLRNLRNMEESGVADDLVVAALGKANLSKVLPFRFIAAYRNVKSQAIKASLNTAMLKAIKGLPGLSGRTLVLVDVSGSMDVPLSGKSDLTRMDAAAALAVYLQGICEYSAVATFSTDVLGVPGGEPGIAMVERIIGNQPHGSTNLGFAIARCNEEGYDRIVVITDEQSQDRVGSPLPGSKAYIINVAPYRNGVGYTNGWTKIDGFSEQVVNYIQALEAVDA